MGEWTGSHWLYGSDATRYGPWQANRVADVSWLYQRRSDQRQTQRELWHDGCKRRLAGQRVYVRPRQLNPLADVRGALDQTVQQVVLRHRAQDLLSRRSAE